MLPRNKKSHGRARRGDADLIFRRRIEQENHACILDSPLCLIKPLFATSASLSRHNLMDHSTFKTCFDSELRDVGRHSAKILRRSTGKWFAGGLCRHRRRSQIACVVSVKRT